jgi:iron complex outermembrane recepter protein
MSICIEYRARCCVRGGAVVRGAVLPVLASLAVVLAALAAALPAGAQAPGLAAAVTVVDAQTVADLVVLSGTVAAARGGGALAGVRVTVAGTALGAVTDGRGAFRIAGVPAGPRLVVAEHIGWRTAEQQVDARPDAPPLSLLLLPHALPLAEVVVTASREQQRRAETPATIHVVSGADVAQVRPAHPSEIMNQVPGVWVNVTGGEGHTAAIRQPKTTSPVYLYLENGVPTRSTGFFNHNALYEVNVPQADRIEVVKGPATALYGSDAIGGTINVLTRTPFDAPPFQFSAEAGAHGFGRVLAAASVRGPRDGLLAELNATRTSGWRDGTAYDRQSGTLRWDRRIDDATSLRSLLTYSRIDQATAGSSALSRDDYLARPTLNYTPISFRAVQALRASAAYERVGGGTMLSITPFARWNTMELMPNWTLAFDPVISRTGHASAGALLKLRRDLAPARARAIAGVDLDFSPGTRREWALQTVRDGVTYTDYTRGDVVYDYDVAFWSAAPYLQLEASPAPVLRVVGGLRFDALGYDYDNALGELQSGAHRRPASAAVTYTHLSPKLGVALALHEALNLFAGYGHGFRAPAESQLFRQGRATSSLDLRPVRADNLELGASGRIVDRVSYELAAYHMRKADDLLTYTHADGARETMNAGETLHRGVEVGVTVAATADLRLSASYSRARHTFEQWAPGGAIDYSGNVMDGAPDRLAGLRLVWLPAARPGASASLDAQHVGSYWMDPANTHRYDGHTVLSARAELPLAAQLAAFVRVTNLLDARYAESASFTSARGEEFAPGMPRALYLGVSYR